MPVIKTKISRTMRDVWDEERRAVQKQREPAVFSRTKGALGKHAEEGFAKTKKYFLEHLEIEEVATDFFPDYQRYLGKGGFTKI